MFVFQARPTPSMDQFQQVIHTGVDCVRFVRSMQSMDWGWLCLVCEINAEYGLVWGQLSPFVRPMQSMDWSGVGYVWFVRPVQSMDWGWLCLVCETSAEYGLVWGWLCLVCETSAEYGLGAVESGL